MRKKLGLLFSGLVAAIVSLVASLSLFAVDANISGVAPSQNTDGSVLTDLASIRIYSAIAPDCTASGVTWSTLVTKPFTAPGGTFTHLDANITTNGRHCYRATAIDTAGNESVFSNTAFKDVDVLFPKAPTGLTVN